MTRILTHEFAQEVKLPIRPSARREKVISLLQDPRVVGADIRLKVDGKAVSLQPFTDAGEQAVVPLGTRWKTLGRTALKQAALALSFWDAQHLITETGANIHELGETFRFYTTGVPDAEAQSQLFEIEGEDNGKDF